MGWSVVVALFVLIGGVVVGKWWMDKAGPNITKAELQERMRQSDVLLLDVRSAREYASGHVPGARNIPHTAISEHLDELAGYKGKDVVVYCQHGPRARMAQRNLIQAGFSSVLHLEGDMSRWRSPGLPIETSPPE